MTQDEVLAHHEAGHAVARILLRLPLRAVDVHERAERGGMTDGGLLDARSAVQTPNLRGVVIAAGPAAEAIYTHEDLGDVLECQRDGAASDNDADRIESLARFCAVARPRLVVGRWCPAREHDLIGRWLSAAWRLARGAWPGIEAVAAALLVERELQSWRVRAIVRDAFGGHIPRLTIPARHSQTGYPVADRLRFPWGWCRRVAAAPQ